VVKLAVRILIGVDMTIGILLYLTISILFGEKFSVIFLAVTIFFAHFPDADMIPFLFLRKKFDLVSHQPIGHHPLILVPLTGAVGHWIGGPYLSALMAISTLYHFVHDSAEEVGLAWLSPFSKKRWSLLGGWPRRVPDKFVEEFYEKVREISRKGDSAANEIKLRVEMDAFNPTTMFFFVFGVLALGIFALITY
jgi:hypothetical protein